jgi:hypothetical protein
VEEALLRGAWGGGGRNIACIRLVAATPRCVITTERTEPAPEHGSGPTARSQEEAAACLLCLVPRRLLAPARCLHAALAMWRWRGCYLFVDKLLWSGESQFFK